VTKFSALIVIAAAAALAATAAAQSDRPPPVAIASAAAEHKGPSHEQIEAMWAPTCRVQCRGQASAPSAVSCQPMSAEACRQVSARNPNCRAELIPANWCSPRSLEAAGG